MANYLKPQSVYTTTNGVVVNKYIISESESPKAFIFGKLSKMSPVALTIHNTNNIAVNAATNPAEQYSRATFNGNMNGVLVHFYVYKNIVWQNLELDIHGWHAADGTGTGNKKTIAIEIIESGTDKETEATAVKLIAYLLDKYGWSTNEVFSHNHWYSKKYCPAYILPRWDTFKSEIGSELKALQSAKTPVSPAVSQKIYRVQVGAYSVKNNAENMLEKLKKAGFSDAFITEILK
ncbi:MAG: N-acetylmuramoyl-L-alanine amidase [Paludibacter sp.]|jgi:N-acetylmuramoyl-L-alanine amidase|nr:N-acetylmuramoyl-L-alanine amidase [Paludibacter sp.]